MRTILGVERIAEYKKLFQGKRIGLITNFSGILPDLTMDTADVFWSNGFHVQKIFTPEHGLYGAGAGESVADSFHPRYHIPVISLYGDHRKPTDEDVENLDLLVYDIQDVGLRYYTYLYTMCYSLDKAAQKGIPYVILDRPNPLGGRQIRGARIRQDYHSFVGDYELPMRYGLTIGEAAHYYLKYTGTKADLTVIPMENYTMDTTFPRTGLLWNVPSPALPAFESVLCYCGGCLFETVNVSEGRGSAKPFQMYGAPFIDMDRFYEDVKAQWKDDSIVFRRRAFVPNCSKHQGEVCYGLEFFPLREECDFLPLALIMMKAIFERYPEKAVFCALPDGESENRLAVLYGNELALAYIRGNIAMKELQEAWTAEDEAFAAYARDIRIYRD
ncbi:MAG: DUF1343 domain-containing protein [Eubacteriales bacterium]|nr:DUF1343 domain-containing protein [Eubacteriales bacterium]